VVAFWGRLDFAHNNAGVSTQTQPITDQVGADWERIFAVNLIGVMYRMKCQMRHMKAQEGGGAIVNTASTAGVSGTWGLLRHGCRAGGGRRLFDPSSCGRSGYTLG